MTSAESISGAVIARLPKYLRYLGDLKDRGIERISSKELSELMDVTASQIRQDLNHFGGFDQQGYGYNVDHLYEEISQILGLNKPHRLVIVGAGHLGMALAGYTYFERRGFQVLGIFDVNPEKFGMPIRELKVKPMDELSDFIRREAVDIAVLTVPRDSAVMVAKQLSGAGVKAILNFAHVDLDLPKSMPVQNVHLSDSLMKLSYELALKEKPKGTGIPETWGEEHER